ncbi:hypothetical protein TRFO_06545 [Tritrichomonas foetus]|uniref:Initiator binding domain-containing protein n=1 Tax=Tritrichomonas foetus TaxID=1144522 RepID=A0A1J4K1V0_9EUKA|nr:hypothetical protein TRFO_06545 [Tritrichomonas foetus]|eukprot:OHT03718.1 hypothetical protein TRFO_06545 [Tritrichomonas foetus]
MIYGRLTNFDRLSEHFSSTNLIQIFHKKYKSIMTLPPVDELNESTAFLEFLSASDKAEFEELKKKVGSPENRYNRNKRLATFNEMIDSIKHFCIRNDGDDWKRCLVCGICWIGSHDLAINTRQLRILIAKSKSTINGALAKMGYETVPTKGNNADDLVNTIPFLKKHYSEMRQWTIRRMTKIESPIEPLNDDTLASLDILPTPMALDFMSGPEPEFCYDFSVNDQYRNLDLSFEFPILAPNVDPSPEELFKPKDEKSYSQFADSGFSFAM